MCSIVIEALKQEKFKVNYVKKVRHYTPSTAINWAMVVMAELLRGSILDGHDSIPANDAMDFMHTLVSSICCDFVFLDGKWAARVQDAHMRCLRHIDSFHLAKPFSLRNNGALKFLNALETYR
jgi:hypothetical protein